MVNPTKTRCIFIGNRQLLSHIPENVKIHFDDTSICRSTHVNNLGLRLDRYMTFDKHVNELTKKALGTLIYINRVSMNFDKETRKIVVQSLVLSQINYCISKWDTINTTLLQTVQKLQKFAARVSTGGMRKFDHVSPALRELRWLKVKQRYFFVICVVMYKSLKGIYPHWFQSFSGV